MSSTPALHPCTKHKHATRAKAAAHLRDMKNQHKGNYPGHVYWCRECEAFHIGRIQGRDRHSSKHARLAIAALDDGDDDAGSLEESDEGGSDEFRPSSPAATIGSTDQELSDYAKRLVDSLKGFV